MSWWSSWLGGAVGYALGGPIGALIGVVVGRYLQQQVDGSPESIQIGGQARTQAAFFTATFSVMGHIAKVDGVITTDEIRFGERLMAQMQLSAEQRRAAIELYRQGKKADFRMDEVLAQFRYVCQRQTSLLRMFMEIQLQAAFADGQIHSAERRVLLHICDQLGFSRAEFERLLAMIGAEYRYQQSSKQKRQPDMQLEDAYALLNIDSSASDAEVKRAYRRMISRHHPDKLISKGLPEEMIRVANDKTHEIKKAYERVQSARRH